MGDDTSGVSGASGAVVFDNVGGGVSWSLEPHAAQDNMRMAEMKIEIIFS